MTALDAYSTESIPSEYKNFSDMGRDTKLVKIYIEDIQEKKYEKYGINSPGIWKIQNNCVELLHCGTFRRPVESIVAETVETKSTKVEIPTKPIKQNSKKSSVITPETPNDDTK
jgi:hypothetical protein